jgi:hypothetical protein
LERIPIKRSKVSKSQVGLDRELVVGLSPSPAGVRGEHARSHSELLRHKRYDLGRGHLKVLRDEPQIAEGTQLESIAQPILRLSLAVDLLAIIL